MRRTAARTDPSGPTDPTGHVGPASATEVLARFGAPTTAWFESTFTEPTAAQVGAWDAISSGEHTLVVAPTGSGKTLSAFLWALDRLTGDPEQSPGVRVLYVSPLKALAVDVERNLRGPLTGIRAAAERLGTPITPVQVGVRSGDTSAQDRRAIVRTPPQILITTPESLYLMLTSAAASALESVDTVIVDEIHAVAGTKRGAHLAVTLDRLDAILAEPAQRIGLSATVNPVSEVARFLAGGRPVRTVTPTPDKQWDLSVVIPVADLAEMGTVSDDLSGPAAADPKRTSIWPHVEERIVDLVAAHRSTLVFANSRRLAERLTTSLNEIAADRDLPPIARAHHGSVSKEQRAQIEDDLKQGRLPAVVATSSLELGIDMGAVDLVVQVESPPSVASGLQRVGRAGHQVGAVSRGVIFPKYRADLVQSTVVAERMRVGEIEPLRVPANPLDVLAQQIVAMCAVREWTVEDLLAVLHRSAPFAGLTRSVLESVLDMLAGRYPSDEFAELRPRITWDRLTGTLTGRRGAQHLAVTSGGTIPDRGLYAVMLASGDPGAGGGRRVGELDEEMVYESRVGDVFTLGTTSWRIEDITHDRVLVTPAPGQAGRLPFWKGESIGRPISLGRAVGAFLREVGHRPTAAAQRRLSEAGLDEWARDNLLAYVAEQHAAGGHLPSDRQIVVERFRDELGDWRVAILSPFGSQVHAPWALAVSARLRERYGVDVQAMHADDGIVLRLPDIEFDHDFGAEILEAVVLDPDEVASLVTEQIGGSALFASRFRECAARALLLPRRRPDRRQALWQQRQRSAALLQVASQYPSFPIVLEAVRECVQDVFDVPALTGLMREIRSRQVQIVDVETPSPSPFAKSLLFGYVAQYLYEGDSPLAEKRAAALSLDPALLAELLGDTAGLSLRDLLDPAAIEQTELELQHLTPTRAARDADEVTDLLRVLGPMTTGALELRVRPELRPDIERWLGDLESARRVIRVRVAGIDRWAAVEDAARLRDALGTALPVGLAAAFLESTDDPLGSLIGRYARTHGPFTAGEVATEYGLAPAVVAQTLRLLVASGTVTAGEFRPGGAAVGQSIPGESIPGESIPGESIPGDGIPGDGIPGGNVPGSMPGDSGAPTEYCDSGVLRTIRRRSLAALRAEVEPVTAADYARFLPQWQSVRPIEVTAGEGGSGEQRTGPPPLRGIDGVARAIEQLSGAVLPASALETLVLPVRVRDYQPWMLDELTSQGEVIWRGHGSLAGNDGWVSVHLADLAPVTLGEPDPGVDDLSPAQAAVLGSLAVGGLFLRDLMREVAATGAEPVDEATLGATLWDLVWAGWVTNDTLAPLRSRLGGGRTAHRAGALGTPRGRTARRPGRYAGAGARIAAAARPQGDLAGRWSRLPGREPNPTVAAHALAEVMLDRFGVVTRGAVQAEGVQGGFAAAYRVLARAEETGRVRRGYFVEGLGAAQFGSTGAVDRLRAGARPAGAEHDHRPTAPSPGSGAAAQLGPALILAASDPANPFGAALPWPTRGEALDDPADPADPADPGGSGGAGRPVGTPRRGHQPGRKAGALVVLLDGDLVLYVERGGRTLLTWSRDEAVLDAAARALAVAVRAGALGPITVERADGESTLRSDHPLRQALARNGFHATPRGLRLRR